MRKTGREEFIKYMPRSALLIRNKTLYKMYSVVKLYPKNADKPWTAKFMVATLGTYLAIISGLVVYILVKEKK